MANPEPVSALQALIERLKHLQVTADRCPLTPHESHQCHSIEAVDRADVLHLAEELAGVLSQVEAPHQAAGTGGSIDAVLKQLQRYACRLDRATGERIAWMEPTPSGHWVMLDAVVEAVAALLTRRDQPEPPAPREWRDALADLVDVCYAEGSSPSWRVCQVCGIEHRPDEAMSGDRPHRKDCIVDVAEKLLTAWTKSQSVSLATQRDAPPEPPQDVMESLHRVFTRNGIASYTDYPHLAGDVIRWACEMYRQAKMPPRQTEPQAEALLLALFDPACPSCHRSDRLIRLGPTGAMRVCEECGWTGTADSLAKRRIKKGEVGPVTGPEK